MLKNTLNLSTGHLNKNIPKYFTKNIFHDLFYAETLKNAHANVEKLKRKVFFVRFDPTTIR
jgi:hypothetical protein